MTAHQETLDLGTDADGQTLASSSCSAFCVYCEKPGANKYWDDPVNGRLRFHAECKALYLMTLESAFDRLKKKLGTDGEHFPKLPTDRAIKDARQNS